MDKNHYYLPHYHNSPQVGHGLGGVLASLFRSALPFISTGLRSGIRYMGKKSITTGAKMLNDIIDGEAPKIALKRNLHEMKNDVTQDFKRKLVGGGTIRPQKRAKITCKSLCVKRKKKSKCKPKRIRKKKQKKTVKRKKNIIRVVRRKKTCSNKKPTNKQILSTGLIY